jgi:Ca-activated chloride channel family protein
VRALAIAFALLLLAPAAAAQEAGTPVVGGGSFASAPLVEPGRYRDTLLPGERLFYGIKLEAGQRLRVAGQLDVEEGALDSDIASGFSIGIETPLREVEVLDLVDDDIAGNSSVTAGANRDRIEFVSTPVLAASGARESTGNYRGPGIWYVSLYLSSTDQDPARVEVPVNLELEVQGEPQPDPSPEPTPAEATPAPDSEESGGGDDGPSPVAVLAVGLVAAVVGAGVGALLARRPRRGPKSTAAG